jgi:hypothetical protein
MFDDGTSSFGAAKVSTAEPLSLRMCAGLIVLGSVGSYALAYAIIIGLSRFIESF